LLPTLHERLITSYYCRESAIGFDSIRKRTRLRAGRPLSYQGRRDAHKRKAQAREKPLSIREPEKRALEIKGSPWHHHKLQTHPGANTAPREHVNESKEERAGGTGNERLTIFPILHKNRKAPEIASKLGACSFVYLHRGQRRRSR
jgi:hypothetical protein